MEQNNHISIRLRILFFLIFSFVLNSLDILSQEIVNTPVINDYSAVSQHWINSGGRDSVIVTNPEKFAVDDIVMLYVVKGFDVDTDPGPNGGDPTGGVGNIGQFPG